MLSTQSKAVPVLVILLVCADARVETRFASSFSHKNRILEGAQSIWNGSLVSAVLCLSACLKLNCQSLTYGRSECTLYDTYLCHPEDRFHLALVSARGITYFDLYSDPHQLNIGSKKEACVKYGHCVEECDKGSWTIPTTTYFEATPVRPTSVNPKSSKATIDTKIVKEHNGLNSPFPDPSVRSHGRGSSTKDSINSTSVDATTDSTPGGTNLSNDATLPPSLITPAETIGFGFIIVETKMTFDDALEHCGNNNLSLAMLETKDEHAKLVEAMRNRKIARIWIGVKKITKGGVDANYIDGRVVPKELLLWGKGQPNNSRGRQICVEMNAAVEYLWNDYDCFYKAAFVCR